MLANLVESLLSRRSRARISVLGPLGVLLISSAIGISPATSSATIFNLSNGTTVSYKPIAGAAKSNGANQKAIRPGIPKAFDSVFGFLDYGGGPVMPSNTNYTIYWRPAGATAFDPGYIDGINRYFTDLAHDSTLPQTSGGAGRQNVDSVATQYSDGSGNLVNYDSHFGDGTHSSIIDTHAYPTNGCSAAPTCLTDSQIQAEISRVVAENNLPRGLSHEYFLITPAGVESCFDGGGPCSAGSNNPYYCAYHGNVGTDNPIIYSVDPYVTGINGCDNPAQHPNTGSYDGLLQGGLSHEHNESITDPIPNSAWTDMNPAPGAGGENGDLCGSDNGTTLGSTANGPYNQIINGHYYFYQTEWSNIGSACLGRLETVPTLPTASFTSSKLKGNNVDFNVATTPGDTTPYFYVWQFNDGGEVTVATQSPHITHTFPDAGAYGVALTITNASQGLYGASRGLSNNVEAGNNVPPVAAFTGPPTTEQGVAASFDGSTSSDSDGTIASYDWNWGDGTPDDSGVAASHTFASAGSYTVTLTVTDSSDATSIATRGITVTVPPPKTITVIRTKVQSVRGATELVTTGTVPSAGRIDQTATSRAGSKRTTRCRSTKVTYRASTYTMHCGLDKAARAALRKTPLTLTVATSFRATTGARSTRTQVVRLPRSR